MKLSQSTLAVVTALLMASGCSHHQPTVTKQEPSPSTAKTQAPGKPSGTYSTDARKWTGRGTEVDQSLYFKANSAKIDFERAKPALDDMYGKVTAKDVEGHIFLIAGHADQRGGQALNDDLSEARAETIRTILIDKYGVPRDRLVTHGYGKRHPFKSENNESAWKENRRVELWDGTVNPKPYDDED